MSNQKGFSIGLILLGVIVVVGIASGAYYVGKSQIQKPQPQDNAVISQSPKPSSMQPVVSPPNGTIKEKIIGDYQWEDINLQSQYSDILWNKITIPRLAGFSSSTSLKEKKTKGCGAIGIDNYLRREGGLCGVGFWLEDSSGEKIDSLKKLQDRFAPVENEKEAVSFVAVTQRDIKINAGDILEGHTLAVNNGFLVHIVNKNTFGCGSHEPTGIILKISQDGEISQIASEGQKPPKPGEPPRPALCVD